MKKSETRKMYRKIEGRGRKIVARFATIFTVLAIGLVIVGVLKNRTPEQAAQQPVPIMSATVLSDVVVPVEESAKQDGYKLVVGVEPAMGHQFSPPTNSVVVTNETHLRLLMEQARAAHQPQQTVQQ